MNETVPFALIMALMVAACCFEWGKSTGWAEALKWARELDADPTTQPETDWGRDEGSEA